MAIIVDKEKKRRDIALSCQDLLLQRGISNITISQIAKEANIGKGTIYEYFGNKEDIVFEIITIFIMESQQELEALLQEGMPWSRKLLEFFILSYKNENSIQKLDLYREFLAISLIDGTPDMVEFSVQCREKFAQALETILVEGIKSNEFIPEAKNLIGGLLTFQLGIVVESSTVQLDPVEQIKEFLDAIMAIIKRKKL